MNFAPEESFHVCKDDFARLRVQDEFIEGVADTFTETPEPLKYGNQLKPFIGWCLLENSHLSKWAEIQFKFTNHFVPSKTSV